MDQILGGGIKDLEMSHDTCEPAAEIEACAVALETQTVRWSVKACEDVDVPAGTFRALRIWSHDELDDEIETFWWSRGVGKVRNLQPDQDELLVDYCIPSQGCTRPPPTCGELCCEMHDTVEGCATCDCPGS